MPHAVCHILRSVCRPYTESICGRAVSSNLRVGEKSSRFSPRKAIPVRYVSFTPVRKQSVANVSGSSADRKDLQERKDELDHSGIEQYPRIDRQIVGGCDLQDYVRRYDYLQRDEVATDRNVTIRGRITSLRKSGGKLAFIDLTEGPGEHKVQVMLNLSNLNPVVNREDFTARVKLIRRGDVVSVCGSPTRTSRGELSLRASTLPAVLSPCLHIIPPASSEVNSGELLDRHVQMLADSELSRTMAARARLLQTVRKFFEDGGFCEVQTPILAAAAGGAAARPFQTTATEFENKKLSLRIAPELWLKRLVVGGMPKVFEIGPSFRNEGLDRTHNPEFTTCEFYAAYHDLATLQRMTERLLRDISSAIAKLPANDVPSFKVGSDENAAFVEIDFIPAINAHLGKPLPNLSSPAAQAEILELFSSRDIPMPSIPTLPRLLDKLCSHYLEPSCQAPTWISNIPECLSPLAKSFVHPTAPNDQRVAARAELFIGQREIVNCYEEENSPYEQRRKFIEQQRFARIDSSPDHTGTSNVAQTEDDEIMKVDEDYLRALEWGLPPTGGWGCGIDRLVMLFCGKDRISDVLSFGSLRAVTRGAEKWQPTTTSGGSVGVDGEMQS